jgi:triphosphoribosyl-dephospho-CoA synthase
MVRRPLPAAGPVPQLVTRMSALTSERRGFMADATPRQRPRTLWRALQLADLAVDVLIAEALLTPKPALVDRRGSGAHRDLDLTRLLRSARSLHGAFLQMAACAANRDPDQALREALALLGRAGERDMLAATGGSNAHRGAIWVIGLLVAARAISGPAAAPREVAALAGRITAFPDRHAPLQDSHGAQVRRRYGVHGARGEARAGFPHVVDLGLPALWSARANGADENCARLDALMAIMASLDDTCLLHRGGLPALQAAQCGARAVLAAGGSSSAEGFRALLRLDADLLARHASPGGCADLLAACLFLDRGPPDPTLPGSAMRDLSALMR